MQVSDDIFLGGFSNANGGPPPAVAGNADPTINTGVGPMGRVAFHNVVPLTKQTNNVATAQHTVLNVPLALTAGTGVTLGTAPDGSGATVYVFDTPRCVALSSGGNMSAANVTVTGYDLFGRKITQKLLGPNTTRNTTKAFASVLSVVSDTTDAVNNLAVGTADIFGLPWRMDDAGYLTAKWANALAADAGTFVAADTTSPATSATGDTRGTYAPSSGSNGTNRLVVWMHLTASQCGPNAALTNAIGVTPV